MTIVRLISPVEYNGRLYSAVNVRRPGPIAFWQYWRRQKIDRAALPAGMLSVPRAVIDALSPADLRRVMETAAASTQIYAVAIAFWLRAMGRRASQK